MRLTAPLALRSTAAPERALPHSDDSPTSHVFSLKTCIPLKVFSCKAAKKSDLKNSIVQKLEKSCSEATQWAQFDRSVAEEQEERTGNSFMQVAFWFLNVHAAACKQE